MTKYVIQQRQFDCAPIALFNALIYFDQRPTWKTFKRLCRECKTNKEGTDEIRFRYLVATYFECDTWNKDRVCKCSRLLNHLLRYPAIITMTVDEDCHTFFVERYLPEQDKIMAINIYGKYSNKTISCISANLLRKHPFEAHLLKEVKHAKSSY